jgi:hypothetical protein
VIFIGHLPALARTRKFMSPSLPLMATAGKLTCCSKARAAPPGVVEKSKCCMIPEIIMCRYGHTHLPRIGYSTEPIFPSPSSMGMYSVRGQQRRDRYRFSAMESYWEHATSRLGRYTRSADILECGSKLRRIVLSITLAVEIPFHKKYGDKRYNLSPYFNARLSGCISPKSALPRGLFRLR